MAESSSRVTSAQTNSHLPIACSEDLVSVDGLISCADVVSASCSPGQSGMGYGVSRNETAVKSSVQSDAVLSLHSDLSSLPHDRSRQIQPPCYTDAGSQGDSIINLRSDDRVEQFSLVADDADMTVPDASPSSPDACVDSVQCTQQSNSRSQVYLPARNDAPVLPVSDNNTPGCEISSRQVHMVNFADNTADTAAAAAAADDDDVRNGHSSSTAAREQSTSHGKPQEPAPPVSSPLNPQRQQQSSLTSSLDKSSSTSSMGHGRGRSSRHMSHETQTSLVAGNYNPPPAVHVNSSGKVTVFNMANLSGPLQIGDHNVMHVVSGKHRHGLPHPPPSSSSSRRVKPKKQITVEARVVEAADLQLVSLEIGNDWRFLGRQLGCSDADLDAVNHDFYVNGQREIAYQMLRGWLEQQGSDAKLAVLARALIGVKRPDVAMKLQLPRN